MTENMRIGQHLRKAVRDGVNEARSNVRVGAILEGYQHGAQVALTVVDGKIEDLNSKVRTGGKLSSQEVFLLTSLSDLRKTMEQQLEISWANEVRPMYE